jgi:hypothetical protein
MAITQRQGAGEGNGPQLYTASPDKYVSLGDLVNATRDDVRDIYVSAYGDQGLSGLVEIIGAKKSAGSSDETVWFEEGRLGRRVTMDASGNVTKIDNKTNDSEAAALRKYDVLLKGADRVVITNEPADGAVYTAVDMSDGSTYTFEAAEYTVIGNAYPQGTNQPTRPFSPRLTKYSNPFVIVKESFHVTGSQASNIGWVNVGGQNMWYLKGELDARRKFMNMREGMLVFGEKNYNTTSTPPAFGGGSVGSEGYVAAVTARGGIATDPFTAAFNAANGFDEIIVEIDKQGAPSENALYLNRELSLKCDNQIAAAGMAGGGIGAAAGFGAFNNDKDMAIAMGFKSFTRGGYTFHKHDWKLLNDPAAGGASDVKGALIPLSVIVDAKTGNSHHSLEMNYKSAGNYSREMEHWVEGGGVLGYNTGGEDLAKFNYRSECNLCVRGANQHFLFK